MATALRTPDDRFDNLPGYDFAPNYVEDLPGYDGLRMHYLDEGPKDAKATFLCLHGEPSWSYLYRKMIPVFTAASCRVVAPDMFGFGRSDKPAEDETYTFHFHRNALLAFLDHMKLENVCLVCQDWGGLLGLTLPMDREETFTRLLIMNTGLAVGTGMTEGFKAWRQYNRDNPDLDVAALMQRATPVLSDAEAAAYASPYPDVSYKGGVRRFPELVMVEPHMEGVDISKKAVDFWANRWTGESFMAIGMQDPVLGPEVMHRMRELIRGCPEPMEVADAGHFVQEWGGPIAEEALKRFGLV